ncbi:MAG: DUF3014 domain-containing protein [Acidobacteriota bacterium]|nr:DUF3014 domain-containing protein [Acidobacteriota bacterium]
MASENRMIIGIFVALVVILAAVFGWWFLSRDSVDETLETVAAAPPTPLPEPTPTLEERLSSRLSGTTLATSDIVVRELVSEISSHPKLAAWLVNEDLVRRFVASVDNIASGVSPRAHLDFLRPKEGFEVDQRRNGVLVIEADSYGRYDLVAQVFASLDTEGTVALYRELEPLIDEAYAEIGPANAKFEDRLDRAFDRLLAVPVLEEPAQVEQLVVTYAWADDKLEALSGAQRHFLRMGPDNVSLVQDKLGELRASLAAPAGE